MTRLRWALVALAAALLILIAIVAAVVFTGPTSLVVIENRGGTAADLSVETTNPGFSWSGPVAAQHRVTRKSRFSDNSFVIVCRDHNGAHRSSGGYVTNGWAQRVDIVVDGCAAVSIDVAVLR